MTIQKAHWNTDGDNVRLSMPFNKVDKERRIVSGFATLDNLDKQNDIVTPEASLQAFKKFRGNIREMHQPLAVGKMVSFKEDKFFDPETKKMYSGIYVSAYVSKGAQDTWEKVLDGTLSGFSIGGKMNKWDDGYDELMDSKVRIIKDYDLVELSLVDTPANQFANILSVEKVDGVDVVKGMDTVIENVFWDSESGLVLLSENETEVSPTSGLPMQNIGFVEKSDNEKTEMLKFLVDSAKGIKTSKITKEESPMTDATNEVVEETTVETVEVAPEADAVVEEAVSEEVTEEAPVVEEVAEEAPAEEAEEVSPADDETEKTLVVNAVSEIKDTLTSAFSDLASIVKGLQAQVDELNKSIDSVKTEVKESKDVFNEFGKRVDAVEADTAFRKSGDIGDVVQFEPEQVQKSLWDGRFLKTTDLFK
jgi:outer membrane murein-binding lipoprotein Lpp